MYFELTPEDEAFKNEVRGFLAEALPEDIASKVRLGKHLGKEDHQRWQHILAKKGWYAANWPQDYGGPGWSVVQKHIFEEEAAAAGAPRLVSFGVNMVAPVIMQFGTQEQKDYYLPRILSGEDWWCQGYSEPGAGSDLAAVKTRAVREDDFYVVDGQKTWTTLGQYANKIFCLVRTDPQAKPQQGITFLLIDMDSPGVSIRPILTLDGEHEVNEVFFDSVRVPVANRVGEENKGWTCAKYLLTHERTGQAGVGISKAAMAHLKQVAGREMKNGKPLIEDPLFRLRLAEVEIQLLAVEISTLRILAAVEGGGAPGAESSILKIKGSEIRQAISQLLRQALGANALPFLQDQIDPDFTGEYRYTDYAAAAASQYFNLRKLSIYGGSNEVQKNIIAKMILEL